MPNRRYHIHVACTADISPKLMDSLTLFFERIAFLTRDLFTNQDHTAAYSRRCIDRCDYVLLLVTDSYGERNNTGVSQLHLSYVYAKTKNKPMMALIKSHSATEQLPRQLRDFIELVEQHIPHSHFFDDQSDVDELLGTAFNALTDHYPGIGWMRAKDAIETALTQTVGKHYLGNESGDSLRAAVSRASDLNDFQLLKSTGSTHGSPSQALWQEGKLESNRLIEVKDKWDNQLSDTWDSGSSLAQPTSNFESLLQDAKEQVRAAKAAQSANISNTAIRSSANSPTSVSSKAANVSDMPISAQETVVLRYSAHAYEKGNLSEVSMRTPVTWLSILQSLVDIPTPFSSYGLKRSLNALVSKTAESDIKDLMPKVHAVSRCEVVTADINIVLQSLQQAGLIESIHQSQQRRELWQLTSRSKQMLASALTH